MTKRRVVVTGIGMVTPLGLTAADTWSALLDGRSGAGPITHFDTSDFATKFACQVKDFDVSRYMSAKDAKKMDIFIQYGVVAGMEAVADAGLDINDSNRHRIGVMVSSGIGGILGIEENHTKLMNSGPRRVSPFFVPASITNMLSGQLSMHYGITGPTLAIVTACTSGVHNIGQAARMIAYGDADTMLAGGAEKASTELGIAGFNAARALSTRNDDPQAASRPWDTDRDGFVLGDGAGVVVLEEYEQAKRRGARIYAELSGFGMSSDAYHMTLPPEDGRGAAAAMRNALNDAGVNPQQVGYINAHGTSTGAGDIAETQAIKAVFGDDAYQVPVSSTKSMTGHLLGAAGAIEAIFSIQALFDQKIPPTINLDNPAPGCDLDYVPHTARDLAFDMSLCNSFGFGGTNGSLLFSRLKGN
ncbi:beta-ketoacyl-ACP synthase II [Aliidiomarina maris]|uniref:3-oxoacyl-[acyl-carrier-protein] synthase 2 n=1 Tax=Aliidiomarina maris TaxID=531312 RepID=A0A327X2L3_9GAMM|nr:beta-ketoacyl-ACP synthase II [Aliidiomarina maris]MBA3989084.1 beta-ketoacyl-[acyl-carrier-protein] synthase II [Idiomarina sp.]MCL5049322.1 beta-ketoacyl-ACP synthase II [Bacillota bacterium]RAJ98872.1 3-oxoacyl-[acyl-carrier-protein] synthase II [Aliidiomarina maris]RUO25019.1 beta-ketoacyl-[acyl-carrier-protein] synthase II [Aliidiomarina maris]